MSRHYENRTPNQPNGQAHYGNFPLMGSPDRNHQYNNRNQQLVMMPRNNNNGHNGYLYHMPQDSFQHGQFQQNLMIQNFQNINTPPPQRHLQHVQHQFGSNHDYNPNSPYQSHSSPNGIYHNTHISNSTQHQEDEFHQITRTAFNNSALESMHSKRSTSNSQHDYLRPSYNMNSINSYRAVGVRNQLQPSIPRDQLSPSQNMGNEYDFNSSHMEYTRQRSTSTPYIGKPLDPITISTVGFNPESHGKIYVMRDNNFGVIQSTNDNLKESPDIEGTHLFYDYVAHTNVLMVLFVEINPPVSKFNLNLIPYKRCKEYYVREPNAVYISSTVRGKKLNYSTETVDTLFTQFGEHRITKEPGVFKLTGSENFIKGLKYEYRLRSSIKNERLLLDIDLEDEVSTSAIIPNDSSSDSEVEEKEVKTDTVSQFQRRRQSADFLNTTRSAKQKRLDRKRQKVDITHRSERQELLSEDEFELSDSHVFSLPDDTEQERHISSTRPTSTRESMRSSMSNKDLIKAIDDENNDDGISMSNTTYSNDKHGAKRPTSSQIISDGESEDGDETEVTTGLKGKNGFTQSKVDRNKSPEFELLEDEEVQTVDESKSEPELISDTDEGSQTHTKGEEDENYIDSDSSTDDDLSAEEPEENIDSTSEKFAYDHKFKLADLTSTYIIIKNVPSEENDLKEFTDDVLVRIFPAQPLSMFVSDSKREVYLEFRARAEVLKAIDYFHGHKYKGKILTVAICDTKFAKAKIVSAEYQYALRRPRG